MTYENPYGQSAWPPVSESPVISKPNNSADVLADNSLILLTRAAVALQFLYVAFYLLLLFVAFFALFEAYGLRVVPYNSIGYIQGSIYWAMYVCDFPLVAIVSAWLYRVLDLQQSVNPNYKPSRPILWAFVGAIPDLGAILVAPALISIWKDSSTGNSSQYQNQSAVSLIVVVTFFTVIGLTAYLGNQYGYRYIPHSAYWPVYIITTTISSVILIVRHLLGVVYLNGVISRMYGQNAAKAIN